MRYLQNVDTRGSTPRTPSLEPLPAAEASERKLSIPKQLSLNREIISKYDEDKSNLNNSRRSQSLESHFECYENKNNIRNSLDTSKSNNPIQMQTKSQLVRKLPALEVKGVSMDVKSNEQTNKLKT